jgi:hypothetical protein
MKELGRKGGDFLYSHKVRRAHLPWALCTAHRVRNQDKGDYLHVPGPAKVTFDCSCYSVFIIAFLFSRRIFGSGSSFSGRLQSQGGTFP